MLCSNRLQVLQKNKQKKHFRADRSCWLNRMTVSQDELWSLAYLNSRPTNWESRGEEGAWLCGKVNVRQAHAEAFLQPQKEIKSWFDFCFTLLLKCSLPRFHPARHLIYSCYSWGGLPDGSWPSVKVWRDKPDSWSCWAFGLTQRIEKDRLMCLHALKMTNWTSLSSGILPLSLLMFRLMITNNNLEPHWGEIRLSWSAFFTKQREDDGSESRKWHENQSPLRNNPRSKLKNKHLNSTLSSANWAYLAVRRQLCEISEWAGGHRRLSPAPPPLLLCLHARLEKLESDW